jgi:hypothetical protein
LCQKDACHSDFKQKEEEHEILDALLNSRPCRKDGDRRQEGGQQHKQDAQSIHAKVILDIPSGDGDPVVLRNQLKVRVGGVEHRQRPN